MLIVQIPPLLRTGFRYTLSFDYKNPIVKGIFANLGAVFLGTATNQIYLAINRFFASSLPEGSIAALNYAGKLMNLPLGIFVAAVASSIFPLLSSQALGESNDGMWETANRGLKLVLLITLPAAAGLMALGQPVVKLLFERAAFTSDATTMTAYALFWFGPGMGAMAAIQVLTRVFYAQKDTKTPLYLGLSSIAVNIVASMLLVPRMGQGGLAFANSIASLFYAISMYAFLSSRFHRAQSRGMIASLLKVLAGSCVTAAIATFVHRIVAGFVPQTGNAGQFIAVVTAVCAGILGYIVVIFLLNENEFFLFLRQITERKTKDA
jgi:putative peptidoglycan lipid II flippase